MTTKKQKDGVRPTDAAATEITETDLASVSMVDNARAKIAAIASRDQELQSLIDKKTSQIDEIETAIVTCEQKYEESERVHNDLGQRVTRENVKLDISKGTMAEEERAEIFASVVRAFEKAQKTLAQAAHDRDEAREKQGLAQSIREEIDEHSREIADLKLVRREYDAVLSEVHAQKGRDLAESIADSIIATRDSYEACEQELIKHRDAHEAATRRISTLQEEYPELTKELWASHGHLLHSDPKKTAGEYCLEGLRQYILTILTHGPKARKTEIYEGKKNLIEYLAIPLADIQELINSSGVWTQGSRDAWGREIPEGKPWHPSLDKIDALIREVQRTGGYRY
jgi:hypothetical protein